MRILIIIPIYNEEKHLKKCLESLVNQNNKPDKLVLVNDGSNDKSEKIIKEYSMKFSWIDSFKMKSESKPKAGRKIIKAFNLGKEKTIFNYDLIGKFDGDIVLPKNYFKKMKEHFEKNKNLGICSGILYVEKNNQWTYEDLHDKNHIRGALKLYSKKCFKDIGGLKETLGWDTVDELLAKYHRYQTYVDDKLIVKHLRPTSKRYGIIISLIASLKLSWKKRKIKFLLHCILGYLKASKKKNDFLISKKQGLFIRNYRLKNIVKKIFLLS